MWINDRLVYQRLQDSGFIIALKMEYDNPELPPIRAIMMYSAEGKGMSRWMTYFYTIPLWALFAISVAAMLLRQSIGSASQAGNTSQSLMMFMVLCLGQLCVTIWVHWKKSAVGAKPRALPPVLLALVDVIIERGGVIEYGGMKIDFSRLPQMGMSGITVPVNIGVGVRGEPVTSSSTMQILDALKEASTCDVIIIDLEEGNAWWETRLLVLLAGAERLKKPEKLVFVGTEAGSKHCFQGWAHASDLLRLLSKAHPQYLRSLKAARSAARQWELVEPLNPIIPNNPVVPSQPPWIQIGLATRHPWMAFDPKTGLPNELLAEQLLASDLEEKIESQGEPRQINLVRLDDLFRPVLNKSCIDQTWPKDRQISAFFESEAPFIAVTQDGKYSTIISRLTVLSQMLRSVLESSVKMTQG